ncbi:SDR family oxidoreductase [Bacillus sp. B15-48]|uniref:SDR family NAD(P)-dependent oxidoreductase n=1 Tax=Bacillus sp. B15-48 TaxID=1548601 RepID=UPI00193F5239|nr:SDR family oxidoreductase [Bacillus sp. B15-48]MBM4765006.1 SDR family NAD(P)-dependent oxidoreductase [Bacillus sp. B15-48]
MFIAKDLSFKNKLQDKVVLLTGGGGGIGLETAKSLVYMGAKVIILDVDKQKLIDAENLLTSRFSSNCVELYEIDLSDEKQIYTLVSYVIANYGCPDVVFHNATMIAIGAVEAIPIAIWEKSYAVNFKAPLLLSQLLLPLMKQNNKGTIVFVSSSGDAPFMGAYEVFKTTQVELCNTLAGELENTNIKVYTIGPGLVKTETAIKGIEAVSSYMGITMEEFFQMNENHILGVEEAGTGFALSILGADRYNGQEIGSIQVLMDFGLLTTSDKRNSIEIDYDEIIPVVQKIIKNFKEQYSGWKARNIFERQWVLRDFKKTVGHSADQFLEKIKQIEANMVNYQALDFSMYTSYFEKLKVYYERQYILLQSYEKNPHKLKEYSEVLQQYIDDLKTVIDFFHDF